MTPLFSLSSCLVGRGGRYVGARSRKSCQEVDSVPALLGVALLHTVGLAAGCAGTHACAARQLGNAPRAVRAAREARPRRGSSSRARLVVTVVDGDRKPARSGAADVAPSGGRSAPHRRDGRRADRGATPAGAERERSGAQGFSTPRTVWANFLASRKVDAPRLTGPRPASGRCNGADRDQTCADADAHSAFPPGRVAFVLEPRPRQPDRVFRAGRRRRPSRTSATRARTIRAISDADGPKVLWAARHVVRPDGVVACRCRVEARLPHDGAAHAIVLSRAPQRGGSFGSRRFGSPIESSPIVPGRKSTTFRRVGTARLYAFDPAHATSAPAGRASPRREDHVECRGSAGGPASSSANLRRAGYGRSRRGHGGRLAGVPLGERAHLRARPAVPSTAACFAPVVNRRAR